jgi:predicted metal-dependent hydrolase
MSAIWAGSAAATARSAPLQFSLFSARGAENSWDVRISRRARRLSMRVFPGGRVEVVVPPGVGVPAVERFVARHRDWAERRARELALHAPSSAERRPVQIALGFIDRTWSVEYAHGARTRVAEREPGRLLVKLASEANEEVSAALLKWLTSLAAAHLRVELDALSRDTGIDYVQLQLRRQRTRWGSCSTAGAISLNVCLMFQRPAVVRYLILHELCHRRHMNHSRRFWDLVGSFEPDWRGLDAELLKGWRHEPAWVFP